MGRFDQLAQRAGSAIRKARIGLSGPTVSNVMPGIDSRSSLVTYEALTADPARWFAIMQGADHGRTGPMISLFHDARDRDTHLDGIARKRTQSFAGRPLVFEPPEGMQGDKEALDIAEKVRRIVVNDLRFVSAAGITLGHKAAITHLQSAATDGYAVSPMDWRTNAEGLHVPMLRFEHGNRFGFCRDTRRIGFYAGSGYSWKVEPLSEYADRFVIHVPMNGRSDYAWRRGAMRSCIIPSFLKREGLRFWLVLTERFGMPQPYARVDGAGRFDDDGGQIDSTAAVVKESLLNLSRHWTAVFGKEVEIGSIPGSGSVSADVHKELIDWADTTMSIGMLGQNLSTKVEGGSFAAAEAHRYVAGDLHLADATELSETLTYQLAEPIVRYNWPGAPVPRIRITTGFQQPLPLPAVQAGLATGDEYRRGLGHDAMPDGNGSKFGVPQPVAGTPGPDPAPPGPMDVPGVTGPDPTETT